MNNINIHTGTPSEATEQPQAGKLLFAPSRTGVSRNALTFTFITAFLAFALAYSEETASSSSSSFLKTNMFVDSRDGKGYEIVEIGTQTWMVENMNYEADSSKCNHNDCEKYGRLYNWNDAMKACPEGWHLPTNEEWKILKTNLTDKNDADFLFYDKGYRWWSSTEGGMDNNNVRHDAIVYSYVESLSGHSNYNTVMLKVNTNYVRCIKD